MGAPHSTCMHPHAISCGQRVSTCNLHCSSFHTCDVRLGWQARRADFPNGCVRCGDVSLQLFGRARKPHAGNDRCSRDYTQTIAFLLALAVLASLLAASAIAARNATLFARQWAS